MARSSVVGVALLGCALASCESRPPPGWATGGAPLAIVPATFSAADGGAVEIEENGMVYEDGRPAFTVDRAGRVYDTDGASVAMLLPDGSVVGNDGVDLGHIGITNAAPPGGETAWLAVALDGSVTYFDADGARLRGGAWKGCSGPQLRTCTLVTHLVALERMNTAPRSGVTFGVGVGVGVGVGIGH